MDRGTLLRKLHGQAAHAQRGDLAPHDYLRERAAGMYGVESLNDLTDSQLRELRSTLAQESGGSTSQPKPRKRSSKRPAVLPLSRYKQLGAGFATPAQQQAIDACIYNLRGHLSYQELFTHYIADYGVSQIASLTTANANSLIQRLNQVIRGYTYTKKADQ